MLEARTTTPIAPEPVSAGSAVTALVPLSESGSGTRLDTAQPLEPAQRDSRMLTSGS